VGRRRTHANETAARHIHSFQGLDLFEPAGQDGRRCQYLAIADQLERKRIRPAGTFDAESLELAMLEWLARHRNDITIGLRRGDMAHVELLSDNWTDAEFRAVMERKACGDHYTLTALCGALRESHGVCAQVKVWHWSSKCG